MNINRVNSPQYNKAFKALEAAHIACLNHPDRGPVGMSHGPFSGVNVALGIISSLEDETNALRAQISRMKAKP